MSVLCQWDRKSKECTFWWGQYHLQMVKIDSWQVKASSSCYILNTEIDIGHNQVSGIFMVAQLVKNPLVMQETWVQSLDWEDSLEKGKAVYWILQYSGLKNSMDYIGHRFAKSQRWLSNFHYGIKLWWGIFYSLTNLLGETWLKSLLWRPLTYRKRLKHCHGGIGASTLSLCLHRESGERVREICEKSLPWQGSAVWILSIHSDKAEVGIQRVDGKIWHS